MGDTPSPPTLSDCRFPVLAFSQTLVHVYDSPEALCVGNRRSLKRGGWFDGMRIIDAAARAFRVRGARSLGRVKDSLRRQRRFTHTHRLDPIGNLLCLMDPLLRLELTLDEEVRDLSLDEVKKLVRKSFADWHGWASGGDLNELRAAVSAGGDVRALAEALRDRAEA